MLYPFQALEAAIEIAYPMAALSLHVENISSHQVPGKSRPVTGSIEDGRRSSSVLANGEAIWRLLIVPSGEATEIT
jgi:hypothetical protein